MPDKDATERLSCDAAGLARATRLLRDGKLVAIPTETVYGLAARADDAAAVGRIFAAKGRPSFNPLIVHVASLDQANALAQIPDTAAAFWPGPVTLVLPRRRDAPLADAISAGLDTVAIRMPDHLFARALIEAVGPLAAPSANRSGFTSPTDPDHVLATLDGRIAAVVDGGPTVGGVESTILKPDGKGGWLRLRPGPADIGAAIAAQRIEAPGQLTSHYSPGKPVILDSSEVAPDNFLIGFGAMECDCNLSPAGDLTEAAARLYACLYEAVASAKPVVAVAPVPEMGIGIAINDRLRRAAA